MSALALRAEVTEDDAPLAGLAAIRAHLKVLHVVRTDPRFGSWKPPADWREPSLESLILKYGVTGPHAKLPKGMRKGRYKMCFMNAFNRAMDSYDSPFPHPLRPALYYCEGFALHGPTKKVPVSGLVAHHAWLITEDGTIYDPTWAYSPEHAYLGLPLAWRFLRESIVRHRTYGVFYNDWRVMTDAPETFLAAPYLTRDRYPAIT